MKSSSRKFTINFVDEQKNREMNTVLNLFHKLLEDTASTPFDLEEVTEMNVTTKNSPKKLAKLIDMGLIYQDPKTKIYEIDHGSPSLVMLEMRGYLKEMENRDHKSAKDSRNNPFLEAQKTYI